MNEPTTCAQQGLTCDFVPVEESVGPDVRVRVYKCAACGQEIPADEGDGEAP